MDKFQSKGNCKRVVVLEMFLAGLTILLTVGLIIDGFTMERAGKVDLIKGQEVFTLAFYTLEFLFLFHTILLLLLIVAGHRVISRACSITPEVVACEKLQTGVAACSFFSRLELLRMVVVVLSFLGEIMLVNSAVALKAVGIITNLPAILGWFFTSEFGNELKIQKELRKDGCNIQIVTRTESLETFPENDARRQNQQLGETMAYSAPAIAYCVNNMMQYDAI